MVISDKHKFVFIAVPKTASKSLRCLFAEPSDRRGHQHIYGGQLCGKHHNRRIPQRCRDWFTFCCVRNPYSRAISLWFSAVYETHDDRYGFRRACGSTDLLPFLRWLASPGNKGNTSWSLRVPQAEFLKGMCLDKILRFEHLQEELASLPFWNPATEVVRHNYREKRYGHWTDYCRNPEVVNLIQQWAAVDFDTYGYKRDIKES